MIQQNLQITTNQHRAVNHLEDLCLRDHLIFVVFLNGTPLHEIAKLHNIEAAKVENVLTIYIRGLHVHHNINFIKVNDIGFTVRSLHADYFRANKNYYLDLAEKYMDFQLNKIYKLLGSNSCQNCEV